MRSTMKVLLVWAASLLCAVSVSAQDRAALLFGNEVNARLGPAPDAALVVQLGGVLQDNGFTVHGGRDVPRRTMLADLTEFLKVADKAETVVIVLAGHVVNSGSTGWFMPADAAVPGMMNVPNSGIPVSFFLDIAARHPAGAVVALGMSQRKPTTRLGVTHGLGDIAVPQGVALVTGPPRDVVGFMAESVLQAGASIHDQALTSRRDIEIRGFVPPGVAFLSPGTSGADGIFGLNQEEDGFWSAIVSIDTIDAYEAYLTKFPRGRYAAQAQREIESIRQAPLQQAKAYEDAMGLNRDARQRVQRDLSILGYNTRGIDGIWGPATRAAISGWQSDNGLPSTGYLNKNQVQRLADAARVRAAELEEEARKKEEELRRNDAAYWNKTGRSGSEQGLRDYLKRYPDGLFSAIARNELDRILQDKRGQLQFLERKAWDDATQQDTINAYNQYLKNFPRGQFSDAAKARIDELKKIAANKAAVQAAQAEEQRLGLPSVTFVLIEQRLAKLGFEPGRVDGKLDQDTRKAIRRFQRAAGLPVTGYLNNLTVVRLIAG